MAADLDPLSGQSALITNLVSKTKELQTELQLMSNSISGHLLVKMTTSQQKALTDTFLCTICKGK